MSFRVRRQLTSPESQLLVDAILSSSGGDITLKPGLVKKAKEEAKTSVPPIATADDDFSIPPPVDMLGDLASIETKIEEVIGEPLPELPEDDRPPKPFDPLAGKAGLKMHRMISERRRSKPGMFKIKKKL